MFAGFPTHQNTLFLPHRWARNARNCWSKTITPVAWVVFGLASSNGPVLEVKQWGRFFWRVCLWGCSSLLWLIQTVGAKLQEIIFVPYCNWLERYIVFTFEIDLSILIQLERWICCHGQRPTLILLRRVLLCIILYQPLSIPIMALDAMIGRGRGEWHTELSKALVKGAP